ncbi:MAG: phage terminase large subunit family protein [Planctomycetaceae bacterium]|nr:phage terminase large subunit family protein [Planctomycetaceae bacterium]
MPPPENPQRRAAGERDYAAYLKAYWPEDTRHPWSDVHLKLIGLIEVVVLVGALLAIGIPRGWGKTFLCVRAVLWAVCYRHHTMCMLIAASNDAARELIQDIRDELENNELLRADFPEICLPIAALEGINQRGRGQTSGGRRTHVKAGDFELHLGDIGDVPGCVIFAGGILSSKIRGRRKKRGDRIERPTLGLVDDFQTRTSAGSPLQIRKRLRVVQDDIPGLPGNDQAWSCLLACTVIEPGDAADQLLDRSLNPDWRGVRQSFLESLPNDDALELWDQWNEIRVADLQADSDEAVSERAHRFYRKHRKAMNAGAAVAWKYAYKPEHYVDALEKAMHWYYRSREGFWSELQNQPDKFKPPTRPQLHAHILRVRQHHLQQHIAPADAEHIVAAADVSHAVLWFEVRAFALDSTSWTLDYGTWPPQRNAYFTQATAKNTIDAYYCDLPTWEVRCCAAIRELFGDLFNRHYQREDGAVLRCSIGGIDANDETDTVKLGIRKAGLTGRLWPMHARSFRPPKTPLNDLKKREGDVIGPGWRRRSPETGSMRYITFDVDHWKSHHRDRLVMSADSPGALTWYAAGDHRMIADHHVAESSDMIRNESSQTSVEVWTQQPGVDNHLWDVGVIADVLGSVLNCRLPDSMPTTPANIRKRSKKKKLRISV